jgi:hypothetical protein
MKPMSPFSIDAMATTVTAEPVQFRRVFERENSLLFDEPFTPDMLQMLMTCAANANFVDDNVDHIGTREIEAPQRVGGVISLLLARQAFRQWVEQATGRSPVRAVAGRLVQTRANSADALVWHDDIAGAEGANRLLGVVINLSDTPFSGGQFEMRHNGIVKPFLSHHYEHSGSMMLFAVRRGLEHRVAEVTSGGPRRVYAGWFLSEPEHRPGAAPDQS